LKTDIVKDNNEPKIDQSDIRTDLIVETIRGTTNAQLQNSSLLLISCLAMWMPDAVLHSVMPIFTFMGHTILRQGDDYSAHVIDETVSRVIPPLVASLRKRSRDVVSKVADLLLSFTAAFEHIPLHRRLSLFERVVNALGSEECLFAIIVLLLDRHPTDSSIVGFLIDLINLYPTGVDLKALNQCIEFIRDMFRTRQGSISYTLLDLKDKFKEEIYTRADNLMVLVSEVALSPLLRGKIIKAFNGDEASFKKQQASYSGLLGSSIRLIQEAKDTTSGEFIFPVRLFFNY
jgi:U3 small nucleolar RNA-associated protein 10